MVTQPVLQQITDLIVRIANPKKVFLFGSRANGTATSDSDFDFMIVVSDDVQNLRALRCLLHLEISSLIESPCDILVEHESAFDQRSSLPTIERTILETGQRLYAA
ncbi:MAG: nucleotidyltransferase domain-containing protein [Spirochaetaceae bacterium]|nr:MAG: nucleotidyltransferase domain-containing protein [Spirochaetaceae bacterium]